MNNELTKTYSPTEFETELYAWWEENGYFKPEKQRQLGILSEDSETFCMTIPPPNVTGILHFGHAIIISVQDLMTRFARMQGKETVFVPGSDHAGIATQNVVERELNKKGIKRKEIGREKFVDEVWQWKEKSHSTIVKQSKMMGLSTDWDNGNSEGWDPDEFPGGCVLKGTKILLAYGKHTKTVQKLKIGDQIKGYNVSSGEITAVQVTNIKMSIVPSILNINEGLLKTTLLDQPIYMRNSSYTGWLQDPINLKVGDEIFHVPNQQWIKIGCLETEVGKRFEVYEVTTDPLNVFVGNGILLDAKYF